MIGKLRTAEEKKKKINSYLKKLNSIAEKSVRKKNYNLALSSLSAYCKIQYLINQVYSNNKTEDLLQSIARDIVKVPKEYKAKHHVVLFYDGFGLDLRGWAASYVKAFSSLDYRLIYVAPERSKGRIPHIINELEKGRGSIVYLDMNKSYTNHVNDLNEVFVKYKPQTAFFYTTPYDVAGAAVFDAYLDKVFRIQVDLTDHAYWIGINAFDCITECRLPGVSNAIYHRGVQKKQIARIDPTPYITDNLSDEPLPFDIDKDEYFFSGGSLYKTLGDNNHAYYKIVDEILERDSNIKFIYAGEGDPSEMNRLIQKHTERVFLINERNDFFRLFEKCVFYLNTYPMFGGLMMRYAALAGKAPLTLKHGLDHEGILFKQDERGIEFDTVEEIVDEAMRLIHNKEYRNKKRKDMDGACMDNQTFSKNLGYMIETGKTSIDFDRFDEVDTSEFRHEYIERLDVKDVLLKAIPVMRNDRLLIFFPGLFIMKAWRKFK